MRKMLDKKDAVIEELRSRANKAATSGEKRNISCDEVRLENRLSQKLGLNVLYDETMIFAQCEFTNTSSPTTSLPTVQVRQLQITT